MNASYPVVSIIIPTYRDNDSLIKCLKALDTQTYPKELFEVIVINNDPHTPISLSEEITLQLRIVCESTPGSYAARNKGISLARGGVIGFTDADCLPVAKWLEEAMSWFEAYGNSDVILAGGVSMFIEDVSISNPYALYDFALGIPQARYVGRGYGVTANLFVPREVFKKIGYFDEKRLSGGDADFCRRAGKLGIPLHYKEAAEVFHPVRCTWAALSDKVRRVKGGQLLNGTRRLRLMHALRTLLPPIRAWLYTLRSSRLQVGQKVLVCFVQLRLWGVELFEMWRLLVLRGSPQR